MQAHTIREHGAQEEGGTPSLDLAAHLAAAAQCSLPPPQEPEKRVLLGRPSNNVKAGLVGVPNVGKSSTFNLMCNMSVEAANFPVRRRPRARHAFDHGA